MKRHVSRCGKFGSIKSGSSAMLQNLVLNKQDLDFDFYFNLYRGFVSRMKLPPFFCWLEDVPVSGPGARFLVYREA